MGIFDLFEDTLQLVKNTFAVVGRNPAILKPTMAQVWIGAIFYFFVILSTVVISLSSGTLQMIFILVLLFSLMLLIPLFPFIKMYFKAAQCWIVYHTFTGNNISYEEGLARAKQNKGDIFILGLFDILFTALAKKLKQGTGKGGMWVIINIIMSIMGKVVEEGWDLIGHYLLPASIIQEKKVNEVLPEIAHVKDNIPGALAGVFGFDFAGDMISGYIFLFMFLFAIVGVLIGIFLKVWIPLLIIIILMIGVFIVIRIFVEMVKTVYFTLFYVAITMPMKIVPEYRQEVTHYLQHQSSSQASKPQESPEEKVSKLIPHIERYRKQGYTDEKITSFLVKNGWPEEAIKKALEQQKR